MEDLNTHLLLNINKFEEKTECAYYIKKQLAWVNGHTLYI